MGVPPASREPELAAQDVTGEPGAGALVPEVLTALTALREAFDSKIRYDGVRDRQIAALHDELEEHRRGLYLQILKPVLLDIIGLYDDIAKMASEQDFLLNSVEEILRRYGAEPFVCEGNTVDRSRQRVIDIESADNADLDRLVARRVRPGFELDGKVIRPEWVVAYRHSSDSGEPAEGAGHGRQTGLRHRSGHHVLVYRGRGRIVGEALADT